MLEEILEKDEGYENPDNKFHEYEEWDSLAYLSVIAKIDEDFSFVFQWKEFQNTIKEKILLTI
jgi:acyl carrier protein